MIVGFTITDFKGHEDAAVEYISRVCILESPDIAKNIVASGPGINVFSNAVVLAELKSQPFTSVPIETKGDKSILVSAVNFNLELLHNGEILRLVPTEYIYIDKNETPQFSEYLEQGLVKLITEVDYDRQDWVLSSGFWDDSKSWNDNELWRDLG